MITITRYDNNGWIDANVERYGYHHSYRKVTVASYNRLMKMGIGKTQRNTTNAVTTIKLS